MPGPGPNSVPGLKAAADPAAARLSSRPSATLWTIFDFIAVCLLASKDTKFHSVKIVKIAAAHA
jgi:hypothetical protein